MENTTKIWIVGCGGSDLDSVGLSRVRGTREQVKRHLVSLVLEAANDINGQQFESGTKCPADVEERQDGSLYASANFTYSHLDFRAVPEEEITDLTV